MADITCNTALHQEDRVSTTFGDLVVRLRAMLQSPRPRRVAALPRGLDPRLVRDVWADAPVSLTGEGPRTGLGLEVWRLR